MIELGKTRRKKLSKKKRTRSRKNPVRKSIIQDAEQNINYWKQQQEQDPDTANRNIQNYENVIKETEENFDTNFYPKKNEAKDGEQPQSREAGTGLPFDPSYLIIGAAALLAIIAISKKR
jgi:hypothetical protein